MPNPFRPSYLIFAIAVQTLHFFTNAAGQDIEARIQISVKAPSVYVRGRFVNGERRNLSFLRSYAGFGGLVERIGHVALQNANGESVAFQSAVPGEYVSDAPFTRWSYSVDLSPRKEQNAAAHVSWISKDAGILMLGDLLPLVDRIPVSAKLVVSDDSDQSQGEVAGVIVTKDAYSTVIPRGKDLKFRKVHSDGTPITTRYFGRWLFTEDELAEFSQKIYVQHRLNFTSDVMDEVFVNMLKFPEQINPGQWQAETRGRNVTIISSDMPFRSQSLQRLHEQLRHEMFHLWIPNGVNLSGNYDWFYEGFALYASLKMAVAMNQIRFVDFLDTLTRAQAIDARQTNRLSLIDASNKRWAGADTYIYARGMVAAFLCDVLLLHHSKGKRSVNDIFREFYAKHKYPNSRTDGNMAALALLESNKELIPVIDRYIKGPDKIAWEAELLLAGLEAKNGLTVASKLSGKQKDLLDALGYNNWRKLSKQK